MRWASSTSRPPLLRDGRREATRVLRHSHRASDHHSPGTLLAADGDDAVVASDPEVAARDPLGGICSRWWPELPGNDESILTVGLNSGLTLGAAAPGPYLSRRFSPRWSGVCSRLRWRPVRQWVGCRLIGQFPDAIGHERCALSGTLAVSARDHRVGADVGVDRRRELARPTVVAACRISGHGAAAHRRRALGQRRRGGFGTPWPRSDLPPAVGWPYRIFASRLIRAGRSYVDSATARGSPLSVRVRDASRPNGFTKQADR